MNERAHVYEFQHERERKEKNFKAYLITFVLFAISSLIYGFIAEPASRIATLVNFLFSLILFFLAMRRNQWGMFMIKLGVWMNVIFLALSLIVGVVA
jgi:diacylglycerol kinase